jgi:aspartate/methionine/tyrosine aminotransferase
VLADSFASAGDPDMISLAIGWPSPRLYPTAELAQIAAEVFEEEGGEALSYLPAEGLYDFREQLALRGRHYGWADEPDEIVVVSGAKQGLNLAGKATLEAGDVAVIESPTFLGMLESLRNTGARVIGVPVDEDGLDVDSLERQLARHEVKLVALQTACHNPTGRNLSEERRQRLAQLAVERNFFIIEDRVYADTSFEGSAPQPIRELAPAHVLYVNSLSKVVGGGLRAGWVVARGPVRERIAMLKLADDFHSPTLIQHIAARWLCREHAALLPRAPRRASRGPRAPPGRRVPSRHPERRPPPVGHAHASARRAQPVLGGAAPRRRVHTGRGDHRRASLAGLAAPVVLTARSSRARRGRPPAGSCDTRGAPQVAARGGRADVLADEHPLPEGAELAQLVAREAAQEQPAHALEMRAAGRVELLTPGRGDLREVSTCVVVAADPLEQPGPLEPVDEPRQSAAAEQHGVGELGHAHAAVGLAGEEEQHLVGGKRQAVGFGQLGVERSRELRVDAQHAAPCAELLVVKQLDRVVAVGAHRASPS